ncbi:rhodanese-like domain-containing protein [Parasalinivibrio latis]|uniref:rhodanese-like domain-containing protein n=1 Tax=Parasalinivibrio latis TaxID=2952610 RepID=UPI0030E57A0A
MQCVLLLKRILIIGILSLFLTPNSALSNEIEEPKEYRQNNYRAAVPGKVTGAGVIETPQELETFIKQYNPVLLDVYPAARKPDNLADTELWIEPTRSTLPGAVWLANVGLGTLTLPLEEHFRKTLGTLTGNNPGYPVVIFCEPSCWHSWNATKRAVAEGYTQIYWYRAGVKGWEETGLPLVPLHPMRPAP